MIPPNGKDNMKRNFEVSNPLACIFTMFGDEVLSLRDNYHLQKKGVNIGAMYMINYA